MRILITCDRYPHNLLDGLILRIYHYVKHLASRHTFDLVCLDNLNVNNPELENYFHMIKCFPNNKHKPLNNIARFVDAFNINTLYPRSDELINYLELLIKKEQYDLIWDAGCNMLFNLKKARQKIPLLADQVDDIFLYLNRNQKISNSIYQKFWYIKQCVLQYIFTFFYLKNAEAVWFVSELDQQSFLRYFPNTNAVVIANGVDENYFHFSNSNTEIANIVFEGTMAFPPNIDAVHYFVDHIFPRIRNAIPQARFTIVGRDPTTEVQALVTDYIEVTGSVPDIRPYLAKANVFVCPMRLGAGIKNKILQAWAMGKAVVSTPQGSAGLLIQEGHNILIREHPNQFADAVISLLQNSHRAQVLGLHGRQTIEAHYTWEKKSYELELLMLQVAAKKRIKNTTTTSI